MTAARNMVAQYKKYNVALKIDELSKDFVWVIATLWMIT
jgi:hypothetical protein